jgi:hypothetical protein
MKPIEIVTGTGTAADTAYYSPEQIAAIAQRAEAHRSIPFVADVLKRYRRDGKMSPKQAAVLLRIIAEEEGI